jgi:hypothetical protein
MATRLNIYIDQGTDFAVTFNLDETDGTSLTTANSEFFSTVRKVFSSQKAFDFDAVQANGDGSISLSLSPTVSSTIQPGKYEYDILMKTDDNKLFKIIEGLVFVIPTMTKIGANT